MSDNELLTAALNYAKRGWAVHPLKPREKDPITKNGCSDATRDTATIRQWWKRWPDANIGINVGKSGMVVVDLDPRNGGDKTWRELKLRRGLNDDTVTSLTGGGGTHFIYSANGNDPSALKTSLGPGVDVKRGNAYIVAPPSVHPSGNAYNWELSGHPDDMNPIPLPPSILALLTKDAEQKATKAATLEGPIPAGKRNSTLASLAGTMRRRGMSEAAILAALLAENKRCEPQLPEDEVMRIAQSVARYDPAEQVTATATVDADEAEAADEKHKAMKDVILELALAQDITLLTDQHGAAFCRTPRNGHFETLPVNGGDFGDWLGWLLYTQDGRTCSDQTLDPARRVLRARAKYDGATHKLRNRTAWGNDGALYYDMSDAGWRVIRVTREGWTIDPNPPTLFRRYAHQAEQVEPERVSDAAGVLADVFRFVNLSGEDDRLLFTVYLVSLLIADIAHPIPVVHGEQGCGKTFALKTVRQLVDPSDIGTLATPWKSDEFVQQLDHHWCSFYDNLGSLSEWQQDVICRAVTGEGHTKRKLYSDDEDVIFTYRRCIALNGINVVTTRPDLLDRSILFELDALRDRRTEAELRADFDALRPGLLGAILDVLAGALNADADAATGLGRYFRLADWAAWGWRIGEALGGRGDEFIEAYNNAVQGKAMLALELHPLGQAVLALMSDSDKWTGTPKELLTRLNEVAEREDINTESKLWPGSPSWVGRRLKEIKPDLRTAGVNYRVKHDGQKREYQIVKVVKES